MLLLSKKVKVQLEEEEEKGNSRPSFAAAPQTSEVMNTVHKGIVKMKTALNLRGHVHLTFTRVCC